MEYNRGIERGLSENYLEIGKNVFVDIYFPEMSISSEQLNLLGAYSNTFIESSPLVDLIQFGSTPYVLILNAESGKKAYIPLISNCDILKELEIKIDP